MTGLRFTRLETHDVRFPTSAELHGSDAMNPDPDYSAAYVVLHTSDPRLRGHGLVFTIGRGNDVCVAALRALAPAIVGQSLGAIWGDLGGFWRKLTGDSQLRWLGPDKGVMHMAIGAVVNAVWDALARYHRRPLWALVADMRPEEVLRCLDLSYCADALTEDEALEILRAAEPGKAERRRALLADGYPAYTTSAGWLGYDDARIARLCREAIAAGWTHVKMKVGADIERDVERARLIRGLIGEERTLMMDANQRWEVGEAIANMERLRAFEPLWIEEPTSPDDVLGHLAIARAVAPVRVASGEHCPNRVVFKQLLSSGAIGICQIDACRVGGVNENLAIMLMAAKYGVPVCPHAGGVGLCEHVQHLSMIDLLCISGTDEGRMIEYVDHLHEHFVDPVRIRRGRYLAPERPGFSTEMRAESVAAYTYRG